MNGVTPSVQAKSSFLKAFLKVPLGHSIIDQKTLFNPLIVPYDLGAISKHTKFKEEKQNSPERMKQIRNKGNNDQHQNNRRVKSSLLDNILLPKEPLGNISRRNMFYPLWLT